MFRPVRQMVTPVGRQTTLFGRESRSPNGGTGAKSAVSDCILCYTYALACFSAGDRCDKTWKTNNRDWRQTFAGSSSSSTLSLSSSQWASATKRFDVPGSCTKASLRPWCERRKDALGICRVIPRNRNPSTSTSAQNSRHRQTQSHVRVFDRG